MENKEAKRKLRKQRIGIVVNDNMDKTIKVEVHRRMRHPIYGKFIERRKYYLVHDPNNEAKKGDRVRIMESRPFSKRKTWRLVEIIERAK